VNASNPRAIAVRLLLRRDRTSHYTEDLLATELATARLSPSDRALLQELAYGVVRWQATLDWLIQRKTPAGRTQKAALQILLRLGLYQLFWLDRIPDHAAVNETVALAKELGFGPQAGFVNAVLRAYLRERSQTEALLGDLKTQQPALGYSHPDWLFARWEKAWDRDKATRLMDWNNCPARIFGRLNDLKAAARDVHETWSAEGVTFEPFDKDWIEPGLVFELKSHPRLDDLPSFQRGFFYVQDPSTLLAVRELDPQPGDSVLDLCAAPGGKTTYIAQRMANRGRIVAGDFHARRLKMLAANCARLGITCIEPTLVGEAKPVTDGAPQFDRALVDAPCSNTGVMRRRVDLRWRIRPEELSRLQATQLALLHRAALQVRRSGLLVYSTCSLEPEENHDAVESFLKAHPEFSLEQERELLPFADQVDGAYVARLRRN
jgi:16S rRNA (cytosine967-C5)-methyltransferase